MSPYYNHIISLRYIHNELKQLSAQIKKTTFQPGLDVTWFVTLLGSYLVLAIDCLPEGKGIEESREWMDRMEMVKNHMQEVLNENKLCFPLSSKPESQTTGMVTRMKQAWMSRELKKDLLDLTNQVSNTCNLGISLIHAELIMPEEIEEMKLNQTGRHLQIRQGEELRILA